MPSPSPVNALPDQSVILLSGDRFFVRRIDLVSDSPIPAQVELALETFSPFSPEQVFYGYLVDAAKRCALVYAGYRRNFSAAEQSAWNDAQSVLPEFLLHAVVPRYSDAPEIVIRETDTYIEAVVWDESSELPALFLHRVVSDQSKEQAKAELLAEASRRSKPITDEPVTLTDSVVGTRADKGGIYLSCEEHYAGQLTSAMRSTADVRDKQILAAQKRDQRRSTLLGNTFVALVGALVLCLFIELGLLGSRSLLSNRTNELEERAPEIKSIESAQYLATKLEKMAAQQLRPFEMLAVINTSRPSSVEFRRMSTTGPLSLDIDAQTANAGDLRTYETALKQLPFIASVEISDARMRSGRTTFSIAVSFSPEWLTQGGGS